MERIDFKSNKITDIRIENNIEIIECELIVTYIDYIIENKKKVVKGNKDKVCTYTYKLEYFKNLNNNKLILVSKKMKKQK